MQGGESETGGGSVTEESTKSIERDSEGGRWKSNRHQSAQSKMKRMNLKYAIVGSFRGRIADLNEPPPRQTTPPSI